MPDPASKYLLATVNGEIKADTPSTIARLIGAVVAWLETETGLALDTQASREIYLGGGGRRGTEALWLPYDATVTKVEIRGGRGDNWTEKVDGSFVTEGRRLILADGTRWPGGYANLRVTVTAGPTKASEWPQDLLQLVVDVVGMLYRTRKTARPTGLPSEGEIKGAMTPWHWRVLKDHRPLRIA
jgi:hypothetical protein